MSYIRAILRGTRKITRAFNHISRLTLKKLCKRTLVAFLGSPYPKMTARKLVVEIWDEKLNRKNMISCYKVFGTDIQFKWSKQYFSRGGAHDTLTGAKLEIYMNYKQNCESKEYKTSARVEADF